MIMREARYQRKEVSFVFDYHSNSIHRKVPYYELFAETSSMDTVKGNKTKTKKNASILQLEEWYPTV